MSFQAPNTFDCPWELYNLLPDLSGSEVKILLTIIAQTFGYTKEEDVLSLSQLEKKTGLSRPSVTTAIQSLEKRDLINKRPEGDSFAYSLKVVKIFYYPGSTASKKILPTDVDSSRDEKPFYQTRIGKLYESILGLLPVSQYEVDELLAIEREYPLAWIEDAFKEASHARARKPLKYALTCLQNWKDNGKDTPKPDPIADWVDPAYRGVRKQY
jgi:phage replication O-like protein O